MDVDHLTDLGSSTYLHTHAFGFFVPAHLPTPPNSTPLPTPHPHLQEVNCTELLFHTITANLRNVRGVASFFKDAQRAGQCHGGAGWGRGHLGNYGGVASRRGVTISCGCVANSGWDDMCVYPSSSPSLRSHSLVSTVVGCESFTLAYQIEHYSGTVVLTSRQPLVQMYIKHDML